MTVTAQATFVATMIDEWVRAGVTDAVVAPGSRSTPLTLGLARDGRLRIHVHLDERSAGFFAVGLGVATGRPAIVVTTSGTAAVELHPAVVEASQAKVPMIVCTADRPPELHHVAAPQTVDQNRLFGGSVRWFVDPGTADALPVDHWRSIASRMVVEAVGSSSGPGPVHVNLPFRDPLVAAAGELPPGRADGVPWHAGEPRPAIERPVLAAMSGHGARGLVVAGHGAPRAVLDLGWPVLADPRSGLRGSDNAVAAFDGVLRSGRAGVPDIVVRVGQPPASKVLGQWLAALPPTTMQIVVDRDGAWPDPERTAWMRTSSVPAFDGAIDPDWVAWWVDAERRAQHAVDSVLGGSSEPTEPGVIRTLTRDADPDTTFFVSSSMPIRDIEWFGHPSSTHRVLSNRGANGIDGVVSTALGVAAADPERPVVAIVGDLAFLYDSSALLWAARRDVDLTIVVLDNDGGGIFSFLPQRAELEPAIFERFFGTPHGIDVRALAAVHGIRVLDSVADIGRGRGVRLLHVRTDRDANVAVHDQLQQAIASALS